MREWECNLSSGSPPVSHCTAPPVTVPTSIPSFPSHMHMHHVHTDGLSWAVAFRLILFSHTPPPLPTTRTCLTGACLPCRMPRPLAGGRRARKEGHLPACCSYSCLPDGNACPPARASPGQTWRLAGRARRLKGRGGTCLSPPSAWRRRAETASDRTERNSPSLKTFQHSSVSLSLFVAHTFPPPPHLSSHSP